LRAAAAAVRCAESVARLGLTHPYLGAHHADQVGRSANDYPCHVNPDTDRADSDADINEDQFVVGNTIFAKRDPAGEAPDTHADPDPYAEIQSRRRAEDNRAEDAHAQNVHAEDTRRDQGHSVADRDEYP
jgi:hypothetical protein